MCTAVSHHLKQAATAVEIFLILLQVLGELIDFARQKRYLHVSRTGVRLMAGCVFDNGRLYSFCKHCMYLTTPC